MIKSIRHKALRAYWQNGRAGGLNAGWLVKITMILDGLDRAVTPREMDIPGLHFHALTGDRKGRYSLRVSANWRITFAWENESAIDVDLEDYH